MRFSFNKRGTHPEHQEITRTILRTPTDILGGFALVIRMMMAIHAL